MCILLIFFFFFLMNEKEILMDFEHVTEYIIIFIFAEADNLLLASQVVQFFFAGFENASLTISNALYELAWKPEIQEKARAEIVNILQKYDGKITYDGLEEMKYLEACIFGIIIFNFY